MSDSTHTPPPTSSASAVDISATDTPVIASAQRRVEGNDSRPERASTRFHAELDALVARPSTADECLASLLDCAVRQRAMVGACWHRSNGQTATLVAHHMTGPVQNKPELHDWLNIIAADTAREGVDVVTSAPLIKNLIAISIPQFATSTNTTAQPAAHHNTQLAEQFTLILLFVGNRSQLGEILLAGQCLMRTYTTWLNHQLRHDADARLNVTSMLLEVATNVSAMNDLQAAAQYSAQSLQKHFDCRLAAIGFAPGARNPRRNGQTVKLSTLSGIGDFDSKSSAARLLESALTESVIRNRITSFPATDRSDAYQCIAHQRAAETVGAESIVSVPLSDRDGKPIGALLLCGEARSLLNHQTQNILLASSQPLGTALTTVARRQGNRLLQLARRIHRTTTRRRAVCWVLVMLAVVATLLMPVSYRVRCRCRLEPVFQTTSLAPYEGMLESTLVKPGDLVEAGQLLARMDGREIGWELAGITAESARANQEFEMHLSQQAMAEAIVSELESKKLKTRQQLLQHRRDNLEIRSTSEGVVLSGSLDQRQNYPVSKGQMLYEIARLDPLRLEIAIADDELSHVRVGQQVQAIIRGQSVEKLTGTITAIRPQSETRYQSNVFIAEMEIPNSNLDYRPGMEGTARITGDRHTLAWNLCHRAWERASAWLWW